MVKLPNKEFRQMIPTIREKGFYKPEEQRKICWPEYTINQIKDAEESLKFINETVDSCEYLILKGKSGRPLTDPKILAKTILLCELLNLKERNGEGWVNILGEKIGIKEYLDDKTIGDAYNKIEVLNILKQVFEKSKTCNGILSGDGTGLETSRKQNYQDGRGYGDYMTSIVDSREIVQAFETTNRNEKKAMHELIKQVKGKSLRLDAGFNERNLTNEISTLGIIPYIFPKKNNNLNGTSAWKNMYLELFYDLTHWLTEYHQRSHCESFHSSFKRAFGIITKRRTTSRLTQITARIILHNRRKISYYKKTNTNTS